MKRNLILSLIVAALLTTPSAASAAGKKTPTTGDLKARADEARAKRKEVVVKLRAGAKILVGEKELAFNKSVRLSGRVTETRESEFKLYGKSRETGEVTAVISYADVLSIKRPSGFEKTLKAVGMYSVLGALTVGLLPIYLVLALMGQAPNC